MPTAGSGWWKHSRRPTEAHRRCGRAPGRVDLMGSHTDYNLGYVLTLPIDRDTWIAARPRADRIVRLRSLDVAGEASFSLDEITHDDDAPWTNYVRGVAWALAEAGLPLHGWEGVVQSTVPIASGLSSSAALECAAATLFVALAEPRRGDPEWSPTPECAAHSRRGDHRGSPRPRLLLRRSASAPRTRSWASIAASSISTPRCWGRKAAPCCWTAAISPAGR